MQPSSCTIQAEPDVVVMGSPGALAQLNAVIDAAQGRNKALLNRMTQKQREELERELVKRATPTPEMVKAMEAARAAWRAQRVIVGKAETSASRRTAPRPRGAGRPAVRGSSHRSSARSGDSGSDGDPPQSTVDGLLRGLRQLEKEYGLERVYELIPASDSEPDRWKARCPVHPSATAYSLLITEMPGGRADVWCSVGCDPGSIVRILVPDPEREARAAAYAEVLLWAQSYGKRRAA